ncbi:peptidylprolyl isomerase [Castellaniella defragrans]|uniref:Chaperone SurA n=3 Tax=Castellaniella defragrans TaxID=75697 RepID=W8X1F0_CASD6|nr:peptidylprolyl isomerase [Castellaniella defragrans]KAB0602668.1 molecular chaperone SurA [Castellaniella defragrans]MBB6083737.1 peptidyl-prolyl cis-trans isomerase SurA [Castellaniella defragrans]CDM25749.1 Peptidyl-prolyl-cis-trans isomerase SurA [Castellaniella defragrans 65Phen]
MMSGLRHPACALSLAIVLGAGASAPALAAGKPAPRPAAPAASEQFVDGIAAVVDKEVITLAQVDAKAVQVRRQMEQQRIPVPEAPVLRRQVLQQMINATLQDHEARRVGIRVSDAQVDQAVQTIAQRNRITVDQLRREIAASGMSWDDYRTDLRSQIQDDILRQRFVEDRIAISDSDIDAFLSMNAGKPLAAPPAAEPAPAPAEPEPAPVPTGPELVELAQILIEVPDYASESIVQEKRKQAEDLLRKLRSGADFAGVAAASSNGPQALEGGNMGIRPLHDWPDLFARAIANTPPGGLSGIVQSGRGFHILKVLRRGYAQRPAPKAARSAAAAQAQAQAAQAQARAQAQAAASRSPAPSGPMMVTQTHARHILIKTSKVVDDAKARATLESLRNRIAHGESFAELARRYSEDASAPQGGDLGWLNPGETVPAFEQAMNALQDGQVSEPVKSPFGWHLIQVEGRQTKNMEQEFRRMQARRELMERRVGPAYEDWLDQLRSQAYIDNRLEKAAAGGR